MHWLIWYLFYWLHVKTSRDIESHYKLFQLSSFWSSIKTFSPFCVSRQNCLFHVLTWVWLFCDGWFLFGIMKTLPGGEKNVSIKMSCCIFIFIVTLLRDISLSGLTWHFYKISFSRAHNNFNFNITIHLTCM